MESASISKFECQKQVGKSRGLSRCVFHRGFGEGSVRVYMMSHTVVRYGKVPIFLSVPI